LEAYINSDEFKKVFDYMALPGKQKYELSDEYRLEQEYLTLKKSEKIKWFFKVKFKELKAWNKTFEDDFTESKLDGKKWITRYFWGEEILKDSYSLAQDKHFVTDGKNIEIKDSVLTIITRQEEVVGKAWDPLLGFYPKDFSYTSGLISTGKSFRQKYGRIKAKIRLNNPGKVSHAFWMVGNQILPEVDIFKSDNSKLLLSNISGNITSTGGVNRRTSKIGGGKLAHDFFIYSLEWTPEKLVWKVNDLEVASVTEAVPQDPLFLVLSSGIFKDQVNGSIPARMDIDWIRVYEKA
jgi:beta-glucanase (GH16 family)